MSQNSDPRDAERASFHNPKFSAWMAAGPPLSDDYIIGPAIADECTTAICKALSKRSGELVAIKYPKPGCAQTAFELECLAQISHPRIISVVDELDTADGPALVLPYARGGNLFARVARGPVPESEVKCLMFNILTAVAYLHRHNIWHRDIKPENILVMTDSFSPDAIVLSDFGYARQLDAAVCDDEFCGSPHYSAPELIRRSPYTEKVDIWALGITMYVCLTGEMPFDGSDRESMFRDILDGLPDLFETEALDNLSDSCRELLDCMLIVDPDSRPSAQQALAHPWFADVTGTMEVNLDPLSACAELVTV